MSSGSQEQQPANTKKKIVTTTKRRVIKIHQNGSKTELQNTPVSLGWLTTSSMAAFVAGVAMTVTLFQNPNLTMSSSNTSSSSSLSSLQSMVMSWFENPQVTQAINFRNSLGPEWDPPLSYEKVQKSEQTVLQDEINRVITMQQRQNEQKEKLQELSFNNGGGTRMVNSYIQNATILQQLANSNAWKKDCQEQDYWWLDLSKIINTTTTTNNDDDNDDKTESTYQFRNMWEELAYNIWKNEPEFVNALGLEYWCNVLTPNDPLGWHLDKDELLLSEQNIWRTPTMGAVYYGYPHSISGGYLEILHYGGQNGIDNPNAPWVNEAAREIERIQPQYNRLIYLNVSNWHRVSEIYHGERYTLAVNVWHGTKPPIAFTRKDSSTTTNGLPSKY